MKNCVAVCVLALAATVATACGDAGDQGMPPTESGKSQEELFSRTVVVRHDDGTETVTTSQVTRKEQLAEQAARQAMIDAKDGKIQQAITYDGGCAGSSIWIFDQTNLAGNEICFYGAGGAAIYNYCRIWWGSVCGYSWGNAVRSYWAGVDYGFFDNNGDYACCGHCPGFNAYQKVTTAGACDQTDWVLSLGGFCHGC